MPGPKAEAAQLTAPRPVSMRRAPAPVAKSDSGYVEDPIGEGIALA